MPANATLSFWHWDCTTDTIDFDWQDAYITDTKGNILQTIFHQCGNCQSWVNQTVDLSLVRGPDHPRQVPGASGWLWRPHRHVCGRCAVNLAVRLDLAYACASTYTHSKAATDAETAPLAQLGTVKAGARERLRGLTVCDGLPIRKACVSPIKCLRSTRTLRTLAASTQRADPRRSSAVEASAAASEPFL